MAPKKPSLTFILHTLLALYLLIQPRTAFAQPAFPNIQNPPGFKFTGGTLGQVISSSIPYILAITGLASFVFVLWSGFQFILSQGNAKQVEEAKAKLIQAIVGFLIVFASYWVVQIIENIFSVKIF